jgi:hypothetical protein
VPGEETFIPFVSCADVRKRGRSDVGYYTISLSSKQDINEARLSGRLERYQILGEIKIKSKFRTQNQIILK